MHWRSIPVSAFIGGIGPEAERIATHIADGRRAALESRSTRPVA
jgi:hypothetical protein